MTLKRMIFTHWFTFCWWCHNHLLVTSQWPDNLWHDHVNDDIELVRYRFFHGDIHSRLCKKLMNCNHWCIDCYEWGGKWTFKVLCHECIYSDWLASSKAHTPGLSTCATKLCQGLSNIYNHFFFKRKCRSSVTNDQKVCTCINGTATSACENIVWLSYILNLYYCISNWA